MGDLRMEERKLETHLCVRVRRKGNEAAPRRLSCNLYYPHTLLPPWASRRECAGRWGRERREGDLALGITLYLQEALQRAKPSSWALPQRHPLHQEGNKAPAPITLEATRSRVSLYLPRNWLKGAWKIHNSVLSLLLSIGTYGGNSVLPSSKIGYKDRKRPGLVFIVNKSTGHFLR